MQFPAKVHTLEMVWGNSSGGFRRKADTSLGNQRNQSIAMTAPVHMWKSEGGSKMAFIMPSEHEMSDFQCQMTQKSSCYQ
ncbi:MAG: hypothetical protein CM1200mP21_06510 [Candidatus Poseidoniales archaeon]|nr:MAG: hypothetical protein CM1200mP21_06510 [Candidatus Poseidoniales archaeon]